MGASLPPRGASRLTHRTIRSRCPAHGPRPRPVAAGHPRRGSTSAPFPARTLARPRRGARRGRRAYRPALPGPFVLDDWGSIEGSTAIRAPGAVRVPSLPSCSARAARCTGVTFALDWRAAGLDPVRFHAVRLGLHLLARPRLRVAPGPPCPAVTRAPALALVVAGAFALHPIQAESVAYAAQRAEVLSSLLYLAALLLLDRAAATWPGSRSALAWGGGVLTWWSAWGRRASPSRRPGPSSSTSRWWPGPASAGPPRSLRRTGRGLLLAAPLLALAAWSAALHFRAFAAAPGGGAGFAETPGPGAYFLTQLRVTWLYLRLSPGPTPSPSTGPSRHDVLRRPGCRGRAGWVLLLALASWLWLRAERADGPRPASRLAAFGLLLWPVVLSPTSSFVPVTDLAVEHRVYLASLGPLLAGAVGIDALLHRLLPRPRAAVAGAAAAGIVLLALATSLGARASTFGSADALWREAAAASPGNARAWTNLGLALHRRGDLAGAEAAYARAWTVATSPGRVVSLARNHAALLLAAGRTGEALALVIAGSRSRPTTLRSAPTAPPPSPPSAESPRRCPRPAAPPRSPPETRSCATTSARPSPRWATGPGRSPSSRPRRRSTRAAPSTRPRRGSRSPGCSGRTRPAPPSPAPSRSPVRAPLRSTPRVAPRRWGAP